MTTSNNTSTTTGHTESLLATVVPAALTWSTALKALVPVIVFFNLKAIPPAWHVRYISSLIFHFGHRRNAPSDPNHLFSPVVSTSRCSIFEYDINGHKSNSTYFADVDVIRTQLVCHLTKLSFTARRRSGRLTFPRLGSVGCQFHREIRLWERYEVFCRVLAWDSKWLYIVTHFVSPPNKDGKRRMFASSLSRMVFKQGRVSVPPEQILRESHLLPPLKDPWDSQPKPPTATEYSAEVPETVLATVLRPSDDGAKDLVLDNAAETCASAGNRNNTVWTAERIEAERRRGMDVVRYIISMEDLEAEYRDGTEHGLERIRSLL